METVKKVNISIIIIYSICIIIFYIGAKEQLKYKEYNKEMQSPEEVVGEIVEGSSIIQEFTIKSDILTDISIYIGSYSRANTGDLKFEIIKKESGKIIFEKQVSVSEFNDNTKYKILDNKKLFNIKNIPLQLKITSINGKLGNAITFWYNISSEDEAMTKLFINGILTKGNLCIETKGYFIRNNIGYYWFITIITGIILAIYLLISCLKLKKDKYTKLAKYILAIAKYKFLLKQLISRDFKVKYKRSILGFIWSFLNPILTMTVQYIVFSSIFRSNIANFPVYLLIGIVFFGFFTEAVGVGILSIVSNASLITKVYVPKYIYPVSKVLSTSINVLFSILPLFISFFLTKQPIKKSVLLLPFPIICLLIFTIGITLILSSFMVFFRDTQFLWGIVSMIWTYATPIFYPISIIPEKYMPLFNLNPMYHYITFIRTIILDGVSPNITEYIICAVFSMIILLIGTIIFKKTQDKFVLYI